jgi:hypothetical protein
MSHRYIFVNDYNNSPLISEWVSEWLLLSTKWAMFRSHQVGTSYITMRRWLSDVYSRTRIVGFVKGWCTEMTIRRQACRSTQAHFSGFEPTSLWSYSLMLCVLGRNNKFYSFWFDPTRARTHDLLTFTPPIRVRHLLLM